MEPKVEEIRLVDWKGQEFTKLRTALVRAAEGRERDRDKEAQRQTETETETVKIYKMSHLRLSLQLRPDEFINVRMLTKALEGSIFFLGTCP